MPDQALLRVCCQCRAGQRAGGQQAGMVLALQQATLAGAAPGLRLPRCQLLLQVQPLLQIEVLGLLWVPDGISRYTEKQHEVVRRLWELVGHTVVAHERRLMRLWLKRDDSCACVLTYHIT